MKVLSLASNECRHLIKTVFEIFTTYSAYLSRVLLLSAVVHLSVCPGVCLFVCQHDNSRTITDIIMNFLGYHPMAEREAMFKNGYTGLAQWVVAD